MLVRGGEQAVREYRRLLVHRAVLPGFPPTSAEAECQRDSSALFYGSRVDVGAGEDSLL